MLLRSEKATFRPRTYIVPGQERRHNGDCQVASLGGQCHPLVDLDASMQATHEILIRCIWISPRQPHLIHIRSIQGLNTHWGQYSNPVISCTIYWLRYTNCTNKMADWVDPPSNLYGSLLATNGVGEVGSKINDNQIASVHIARSLTKEPKGEPSPIKKVKGRCVKQACQPQS